MQKRKQTTPREQFPFPALQSCTNAKAPLTSAPSMAASPLLRPRRPTTPATVTSAPIPAFLAWVLLQSSSLAHREGEREEEKQRWGAARSKSRGSRTLPTGRSPSPSAGPGLSRRPARSACSATPMLASSSSPAPASSTTTAHPGPRTFALSPCASVLDSFSFEQEKKRNATFGFVWLQTVQDLGEVPDQLREDTVG
jgi:hypothetical protein